MRAGRGYVVGGTAWDLTSTKRIGRGQLDLVVVDEAGQFSLAKTLACSVAGDRLLLLGDPQQLPQVSQGTHPDPVDASALGWLIGDEPVLPAELGYFLETTWRMHPALTEPVSRLSYAGQLRSEATVTAARTLEGVEPGLHVRLVDHHDNSTWSPEEAEVVRDLVHDLLGRTWHDPEERGADGAPVGPRPLRPADVIVITPYNGQVGQLRRTLDDAGLADVPVGTVDKFQGQEAAVAILSLAASSHSDVLARHGLPARPAPAQRGDLARSALRLRRAVHRAHRLRAAHPVRADRPRRVPRAVRGRRDDGIRRSVGAGSRLSQGGRAGVRPGRRGPARGSRFDRRVGCQVRPVAEPLEPAHHLVVHRVGPAQPAALVEQVLVDGPLRRVHDQRAGLPAAQAAVAPDQLLERRHLVEDPGRRASSRRCPGRSRTTRRG